MTRLRNIVSIGLALLILLQSLSVVGIFISFKINQDYIAKNLCINRNKPAKKCNGKCQLTKKIAESTEKKPDQAPVPKPDELNQILAIYEIYHAPISFSKIAAPQHCFAESPFTTQSCVLNIFHPPQALSRFIPV